MPWRRRRRTRRGGRGAQQDTEPAGARQGPGSTGLRRPFIESTDDAANEKKRNVGGSRPRHKRTLAPTSPARNVTVYKCYFVLGITRACRASGPDPRISHSTKDRIVFVREAVSLFQSPASGGVLFRAFIPQPFDTTDAKMGPKHNLRLDDGTPLFSRPFSLFFSSTSFKRRQGNRPRPC